MNLNLSYKQSSLTLLLFTLILALLLKLSQATISSNTSYDGVVYNYNSYTRFSGSVGVEVDDKINSLQSYTFSIWFKIDSNSSELGRVMDILTFKPGYQCSVSSKARLSCATDVSASPRSYSLSQTLDPQNWYILTIRSRSTDSLIQVFDISMSVYAQDKTSKFFPFGYDSLSFEKVFIGIDSDSRNDGFIGNIRNLKLFSDYYDDATMMRTQFIYIFPFSQLVMQILINDPNDLRNDADRAVGYRVGKGELTKQTDFMGSIWCWFPQDIYTDFVQLSPQLKFTPYVIPATQFSVTVNYNTAFQAWFKRSNTATIDYQNGPDEILFWHTNVTKIYFRVSDYNNIRVDPLIYTNITATGAVAINRWFFLQVTTTSTDFSVKLFEEDGTQVPTNVQAYPKLLKITSRNISIGQNFNGYIQGLKYYKTSSPPQNGIYAMNQLFDSSSDCLMYFLFNKIGMSDDGSFSNLATFSKTQSLTSNKQYTYSSQFIRQYGAGDLNGTINQPLTFDGYTCKDNKDKVFMADATSYASVSISLNNSLTYFTIEFWFKPTSSILGDAFMMTLQDQSKTTSYTTIKQDSDRTLNCYPSFTNFQSNKVAYLDYQNNLKQWMHIACIIDSQSLLVQGTFFYDNLDYVYYNEIPTTINLPKQDYNIYLNIDPKVMANGVDSSYYQELRFWSYGRSTRKIQEGRYHQLDPSIEQPYLYTYAKLMSGQIVYQQQEIDYSDYTLQRQVQFNNIRWQQMTDLIVCPLGTFKGDFDKQLCYREGIITLQAVVYKNSTHYFVTSFFTIFRNNYLRDNANNIYNYAWTLTAVDNKPNTNSDPINTYVNKQKYSDTMIFSYAQVSLKTGRYDFKLETIDKNNFQTETSTTVKFRTFECANIFDKDTIQSFVYKDMDSERGVENAYFYYDYTECGDFRFSQDDMVFTIDVNDKFAFQDGDHNKTEKSFAIRPQLQPNLPLNDYFYFRIKGVWRNQSNRNDIIEYNLIYACRYISKLIPKLTPSSYLVFKGDLLTVDFVAKYYNMKQATGDRNFTIQWQCPDKLNSFCSQASNNKLKISYDQFSAAGLESWKPQQIKLIARTNFIQGDGTKQSESSVYVTWLNVNPNAQLIQQNQIISKEQRVVFQLNINNLLDNQVTIQWILNPSLNLNCYLNSDNRQQLVLDQLCLVEGVKYTVTSNILYKERQRIIWTKQLSIQMPVSPSKGKVTCGRTSGRAYIDKFQCSASGWVVQNSPARYQFFITDINNGLLVPVSTLSTSNDLSTVLPPTKKLTLKVIDGSQGIAYSDIAVNIDFSNSTQILNSTTFQSLYQDAQSYSNSYSSTAMVTNLLIISQALQNIGNSQTTIPVQTKLQKLAANTTTNQTNATSTTQQYNQQDLIYNMTTLILSQAKNLNKFSGEQTKRSFITTSASAFKAMTDNKANFNTTNINLIQDALLYMVGSDAYESLDYLINDDSFQRQFLAIQENILNSLKSLLDKGSITNSITDSPPTQIPQISNITKKLRNILSTYEAYLSTRIYEGQYFYLTNTAFKIDIQKFSRIGKTQVNQTSDDEQYARYFYPLQTALQPTARQSFSVINFKVNPFIGDYYLNQTATSKTSVYFSYRDDFGNYLSGDYIQDLIQITYKYDYSPLVFLPNVTTCGYIGLNDAHWENKSCQPEFHRDWGQIICHCKHMSYYSIIDDYLIRPQKFPLVYLTFRNWTSFIVFLYVVLIFVIGTIYTYNKDNQDFRYLHDQEEQQGNIMQSEDSLTVVSLAFKRKVFFMMFAEKYKFSNLFKIYVMLMHPLFQLKYKLDPETPRFYRFLMLYSRMVFLFGLSFWTMREVKNLEDIQNDPDFGVIIFEVIIFIVLGSILIVPVPILLLCCCRSRYYLIDPKGSSRPPSDNELDDPNGIGGGQQDYRDRVTDVMIDTNIPIKLLFLINAHKVEDIMKDYTGRLRYATGEIIEVGKKLYELDSDIQTKINDKKNITNDSGSDGQNKERKKSDEIDEVHTQQNLKANRNPNMSAKVQQINNSEKVNDVSTKSIQNNQSLKLQNNQSYPNNKSHQFQNQDSNRPLRNRDASSYDISANKTEQNILDPMGIDLEMEEENLDDEEYEDKRRQMHEGGQSEMEFPADRRNGPQQQQQQQEEEMASEQDSIDTQLFTDEKKELIEDRNSLGRIIGNVLALCFNLAIIISVLAIFIKEGYYDLNNQYVWVIIFFGAQIFSIFVTDMLVLLIIALCVTRCFKSKKVCLAKWMRESLYIYEDYKYVVQFANTKIQ